MGSNFAHDLADAVNNDGAPIGALKLRNAVKIHLRSNHFPPLPYELVDVAVGIIERAERGQVDDPVQLPEGISWRGQSQAPFWECVRAWHLDAFLPDDDDI